ncbi:MAG: hypothetical protein R6U01_14400 [Halorubrum sp.]|uniref:hypothetical protein n=1 Tax=Halorubrum sp. TaxID=1879286 RepID=UPI0039706242
MTDPDVGSPQRPVLLAATPSAERVVEWLRTLLLLAGVSGLLIALVMLELLVRL